MCRCACKRCSVARAFRNVRCEQLTFDFIAMSVLAVMLHPSRLDALFPSVTVVASASVRAAACPCMVCAGHAWELCRARARVQSSRELLASAAASSRVATTPTAPPAPAAAKAKAADVWAEREIIDRSREQKGVVRVGVV